MKGHIYMEFIGSNLASLVQFTQTKSTDNSNQVGNKLFGFNTNQPFVNDPACTSIPAVFSKLAGFDMTMDGVATFSDFLFVAQDNLSIIREKGEGIRDLVAKAQEDDCSEEICGKENCYRKESSCC